MNELFNKTNLKQSALIKFIADNITDEHIFCKITYALRSDRIDVPYYLDTKVEMSYCTNIHDKGLIHAMDIINHHRMHNLTKEKYSEIKEEFETILKNETNPNIIIEIKEKRALFKVLIKNQKELKNIFQKYNQILNKIDSLA